MGVGSAAQDLLDYVNDLHSRGIYTGARFNSSGRLIPSSLGSVSTLKALVSNAINDMANRVTSTTSADFPSLVRLRDSLNRQVSAREAIAQKHSNEDAGHRGYREAVTELRDMVDLKIAEIEAARVQAASMGKELENMEKWARPGEGASSSGSGAAPQKSSVQGTGSGSAWSLARRSTKTSAPPMTLGAGSVSNNKGSNGSLHRALSVAAQRQRNFPRPTLHNSNSFWDESYGMKYNNNNRKPPPPEYEGGKRKTRRRKHKKKRTIKKRHKKRKRTKRRRKH